jgi:serine/threonine protein kinase
MEINDNSLSSSMIKDHLLEMPPLHGRWALLRTVLSGQRPGSDHETRLAFDLANRNRVVVIKRVAPPTADQDQDRLQRVADRFKMEMRRQSSISSPYVAPVIDSGFAPEFGFFIVTKRYAGTIADRLKRGPRASLTLGWGLSVIEDVLGGLIDCFEQTGIVHLDIKPSNIALTDGDNVRLIDFGLARPASDGDTGSAPPGFTAFYAPPEQMLRRPDPGWCTPACDIRAVAATLYEIITGTPPLYKTALDAGLINPDGHLSPEGHRFLIKWMNTDRVIPPDQIVQWLPGSVNELIMNWLDPNPLIRGDLRTAIKDLRMIRLSLQGSIALRTLLRRHIASPVVDYFDSEKNTTGGMPLLR